MAQQGKKKDKGTRNSDRRNGKAWKKNPGLSQKRTRTPERQEKDLHILELREHRRISNKARRELEKQLAEELAAQVAEEVAQKVAEENSRIAAVKILKKSVHRVHVVA